MSEDVVENLTSDEEYESEDDEDDLNERMQKIKVETLVHQYLEAQKLQVIAENGMTLAVDAYVDKEDKYAFTPTDAKSMKMMHNGHKLVMMKKRPAGYTPMMYKFGKVMPMSQKVMDKNNSKMKPKSKM